MKWILGVLGALLLSTLAAKATGESYEQLVERVKKGDVAVDFLALRYAYSESKDYNPYSGSDATGDLVSALEKDDCKDILDASERVLEDIFVDIRAHVAREICFERAKNDEKSKFHHAIAIGLLGSIIKNGDGKTAKTAWVVISVDEEYAVLSALGLKLKEQALVQAEGHSFDLMTVEEGGKQVGYYFQIDRPMSALARSLSGKN